MTFNSHGGSITWQLAFSEIFYPASSNYYTMDFTMSPGDSFAKLGGVEIDAGVLVWEDYLVNEAELRLFLQPLASTGFQHLATLPRPSNYWYPYSS